MGSPLSVLCRFSLRSIHWKSRKSVLHCVPPWFQPIVIELPVQSKEFTCGPCGLRRVIYRSAVLPGSRNRHDRTNAAAPALDIALIFATRLLRKSTNSGDLIADDIRIGLQYLAEELKYRNPAEYEGPVPYEDVPWFRMLCGQLANELARRLGRDDPAVQLWAQQIAEEPLTYVRRAVEAPQG